MRQNGDPRKWGSVGQNSRKLNECEILDTIFSIPVI